MINFGDTQFFRHLPILQTTVDIGVSSHLNRWSTVGFFGGEPHLCMSQRRAAHEGHGERMPTGAVFWSEMVVGSQLCWPKYIHIFFWNCYVSWHVLGNIHWIRYNYWYIIGDYHIPWVSHEYPMSWESLSSSSRFIVGAELHEDLRGTMGFQGFVMSDWLAMHSTDRGWWEILGISGMGNQKLSNCRGFGDWIPVIDPDFPDGWIRLNLKHQKTCGHFRTL